MGRKKDPEAKDKIVKAAFTLFLKEGFKAVTITKIMEATSLSKGAIYHYFKSKEEIYRATLENYYFNWINVDILNVETGDFRSDVRILYGMIATHLSNIEKLSKEGMNYPIRNYFSYQLESESFPEVRKKVAETVKLYKHQLAKLVRRAQEKNQIRQDLKAELISLQLIGLMEGTALSNSTVKNDVGEHLQNQFENIIEGYIDLICVKE